MDIFNTNRKILRYLVWHIAKLFLRKNLEKPSIAKAVWLFSELKLTEFFGLIYRVLRIKSYVLFSNKILNPIRIRIIYLLIKKPINFIRANIENADLNQRNFTTNSIGVVLVTFGNNPFLKETLLSITYQTLMPAQTVLVISGSVADQAIALEQIKEIHIPNFEYLLTKAAPAGYNRNIGADRMSTEYLLFLDGDDLLLPKAIEVFNANIIINNRHHAIGSSCSLFPIVTYYNVLPRIKHKDLMERNQLQLVSVIRRDSFYESGGFRDSGILGEHHPEDWDFWFRFTAKFGPISNIRDILHKYRQHNLSTTSRENGLIGEKVEYWRYVINTSEIGYWTKYDLTKQNRTDMLFSSYRTNSSLVLFDDLHHLDSYLDTLVEPEIRNLHAVALYGKAEEVSAIEEKYKQSVSIFCIETSFLNMKTGVAFLKYAIASIKISHIQPASQIKRIIQGLQRKS